MMKRVLRILALALPSIAVADPAQTPPVPLSSASVVQANAAHCAPLTEPGMAGEATRGAADRSLIQAGLRVYFGADTGFLSDGIIGPVSSSFLSQLCDQIPLQTGTDIVSGTLDVARAFGELSGQSPDWRATLLDPRLLEGAPTGHATLRLAGGGTMAASVFAAGHANDATTCAMIETHDFSQADVTPERVQRAVSALGEIDPALAGLAAPASEPGLGPATRTALARICEFYPLEGGPDRLAAALDRLGRLEAARPGAMALIASDRFALWLSDAPVARIPRLLGSAPAALALLAEFEPPEGDSTPVETAQTGANPRLACRAPAERSGPEYFSLSADDLEALSARTGIHATLGPLSAQRFATRDALHLAISEALGVEPASCAGQVAAHVLEENTEIAEVFSLDPDAVSTLALKPEMAATLGALSDLNGIEATQREELEAAIESAVRATVGDAQEEAAGEAADVAAAAAEDVTPAPDTAAPGFDFFEPIERPQEFAITDTSILMIEAEVTDRAFFEAINATPYKPVPSREMVRADMLIALRPVINERTEETSSSQLDAILETVHRQWRLDDTLIAALAEEPEFAAVTPEVHSAAQSLAGIAYPNTRLFDLALGSLEPAPGESAQRVFDDVARKRINDPYARRAVGPIAADCGCNVPLSANTVVYGFYPFWLFPEDHDAEIPKVDFETISRIAFDGLEIDAAGHLHYGAQWRDAGATFVASAHRHEAKADVAVRLTGWRGWSDDARRSAVDAIEDLMQPQPTETFVVSRGPLGGLDRFFSRQPDGVTLIVDDYDGSADSPEPETLRTFVRTLSERLADRNQSINLAFDIPLMSGADEDTPLFEDLYDLIVKTREESAPLVNHVLVFLERPTSDAKKRLRGRIERSFRGEERIQVLRSIIPVVPSGAHAPLDHSHASPGDPSQGTTSTKNSYGQFDDDLVYFQDNFDGVGFWPVPIADATLPDGTPDRLAEIVNNRYYSWTPTYLPETYANVLSRASERICRVVCPNRLAAYGITLSVLGVAGMLSLLTYYSGRIRSLCETLLLVPILLFIVLALLALIAACDAANREIALGGIAAIIGLMTAASIFGWYERRLDGPMP
ncbi:MAG: hypothetical protein AAGG56_15985 [Pseudomonadota bacterium]